MKPFCKKTRTLLLLRAVCACDGEVKFYVLGYSYAVYSLYYILKEYNSNIHYEASLEWSEEGFFTSNSDSRLLLKIELEFPS